MASNKRKRSQPIESDSSSPSHFFKVILPSSIEDKKLKIPEKFARKFGLELRDDAKLTVPNGLVWQVGLEKEGKDIWFHGGWHDFVKYHSITVGSFLVFRYAKNSTFDVLIFDMTACEIDYPTYNCGETKTNERNSVLQGHDIESEGLIEIPVSEAPADKSRNLNKIIKKETAYEECVDISEEMEEGDEFLTGLEEMGICVPLSYRSLSAKERKRAVFAARLFAPINPAFMNIRRREDKRRGYMYIPSRFSRKYMAAVRDYIKVRAADGREWLVQASGKQTRGLSLSKGWPGVLNEMNLGSGDVCIFELVKEQDEFLLKLSVFCAASPSEDS